VEAGETVVGVVEAVSGLLAAGIAFSVSSMDWIGLGRRPADLGGVIRVGEAVDED
jgi:hypothetical protein